MDATLRDRGGKRRAQARAHAKKSVEPEVEDGVGLPVQVSDLSSGLHGGDHEAGPGGAVEYNAGGEMRGGRVESLNRRTASTLQRFNRSEEHTSELQSR